MKSLIAVLLLSSVAAFAQNRSEDEVRQLRNEVKALREQKSRNDKYEQLDKERTSLLHALNKRGAALEAKILKHNELGNEIDSLIAKLKNTTDQKTWHRLNGNLEAMRSSFNANISSLEAERAQYETDRAEFNSRYNPQNKFFYIGK